MCISHNFVLPFKNRGIYYYYMELETLPYIDSDHSELFFFLNTGQNYNS